MNTIQSVSVIRDRGQLTIPDEIRKALAWLSPESAVTVIADKTYEITIRPQSENVIDWDAVWNAIELARLQKGKHGNLSKFISEDRYNH